MSILGKLIKLGHFMENYPKGTLSRHNEKERKKIKTSMLEEEMFIGSIFIGDVSNFDLSEKNKREENLGRLGHGYLEE